MSDSRIVCVCVRVRMYVLVADLFLPFPLGLTIQPVLSKALEEVYALCSREQSKVIQCILCMWLCACTQACVW